MLGVYVYRSAFRKLRKVGAAIGERFTFADHVRAVGVLLTYDLSVVAGNVVGTIDRWLRPKWRRMTEAYLERGEQAPR